MTISSTPTLKLSTTSKKILIVGAGYLGLRLARRLSSHHEVMTANRRFFCPSFSIEAERDGRLEQESHDGNWASIVDVCAPDHIFICWTPKDRSLEAYQHTYVDELRALLSAGMALTNKPSITYSGSSAVWESTNGEFIDDQSLFYPPKKEKNRILFQAEQFVDRYQEESCRPACTLRLSGLYGPDRLPGLRRLLGNMDIVEHPDGWINLLHIDDAVSAMISAFEHELTGAWGVNGETIRRGELYEGIQRQHETPAPRWSDSPEPSLGRQLRARSFEFTTGWQPEHTSVLSWMVEAH